MARGPAGALVLASLSSPSHTLTVVSLPAPKASRPSLAKPRRHLPRPSLLMTRTTLRRQCSPTMTWPSSSLCRGTSISVCLLVLRFSQFTDVSSHWLFCRSGYKLLALHALGWFETAAELGFTLWDDRVWHPNHYHVRLCAHYHSLSLIEVIRKGEGLSPEEEARYQKQVRRPLARLDPSNRTSDSALSRAANPDRVKPSIHLKMARDSF